MNNSIQPKNGFFGSRQLLVFIYGIFAISAFSRAAYQILTDLHTAPFAYTLSACTAIIYIATTVSLSRVQNRKYFLIAIILSIIELLGVLSIGILTIISPDLFTRDTVWSFFGRGYGYIPLILPIFSLIWLLKYPTAIRNETPLK